VGNSSGGGGEGEGGKKIRSFSRTVRGKRKGIIGVSRRKTLQSSHEVVGERFIKPGMSWKTPGKRGVARSENGA